MTLVDFINSLSVQVSALAWGLFLLTWSLGWVLRGAPIPFLRVKRAGQSLVEDAIWAAFWLAMGSTLLSLVHFLVQIVGSEVPSP